MYTATQIIERVIDLATYLEVQDKLRYTPKDTATDPTESASRIYTLKKLIEISEYTNSHRNSLLKKALIIEKRIVPFDLPRRTLQIEEQVIRGLFESPEFIYEFFETTRDWYVLLGTINKAIEQTLVGCYSWPVIEELKRLSPLLPDEFDLY